MDIWVVSFFGLLESTLETTLISHCSESCHCPAKALPSHLKKHLSRIAMTQPASGSILLIQREGQRNGEWFLEASLQANKESSDTPASSWLLWWFNSEASVPHHLYLPELPMGSSLCCPQDNVFDNKPCTGYPLSCQISHSPTGVSWDHSLKKPLACWVLVSSIAYEGVKLRPYLCF